VLRARAERAPERELRSSTFDQSQLAGPIKEALAKILPCISGPRGEAAEQITMTNQARIQVDPSGKPKTTSALSCVVQAFDAMTLPGMDSLVIDLTST
jgi:hypothetical protein